MHDEPHGPIKLPKGGLVPDEDLEKFSTLTHVRTKLAGMGIMEPQKPEFDLPDIPGDLLEISDKEVGNLYSQMLAWDSYFSLQAAWAEAELKEAKNKLTLIVSKLKAGKKKDVDNDSRVQSAKAEVQEIEQTAGILETTHKVFSAKLRMVSRVIEVRKLDWEKNARDGGIRAQRYPHSRLGADKR